MTRKGVVAAGSMLGFFSEMPLGMLRLCPHRSGGDSGGTQNRGQLQTKPAAQGQPSNASRLCKMWRLPPEVSSRMSQRDDPMDPTRSHPSRLEQHSISKTFTFNN